MKVLHIITTLSRGGAESHLVDLVEGELDRGHVSEVAYLKGDGYWQPRLEQGGVGVWDLGGRGNFSLVGLTRLRARIACFAPSLLHFHMPPAELTGVLAALGSPIPIIVTKHNDEPFCRPAWLGVGLERFCAWRARNVIAISPAVRRYFSDTRGTIPLHKISVIPYGLDPTPFQSLSRVEAVQLRSAWGVDASTVLIGCVARLEPQKDIGCLLDAFQRLHGGAVNVRLVIVGTGSLRDSLGAHARRLGLENHVVWAGFREDMPRVMAAFDIFAMSSRHEGFGRVFLEAMSAGRPVVATSVSSIPDIVEDGVTGRLVPASDPEAMAKALVELVADPGIRETMGAEGYRRVCDVFSKQRMVDSTLRLYDQALDVRTGVSPCAE